jgi:hypothetical protein
MQHGLELAMRASRFALTPEEQVAVERILHDFPETAAPEGGIAPVVEELIRTLQGFITTEEEPEAVLEGLVDRIAD